MNLLSFSIMALLDSAMDVALNEDPVETVVAQIDSTDIASKLGPRRNSDSSITLVDFSGREFHTRLRKSDLEYLMKQAILANFIKAHLEDQATQKNRARYGRTQDPINASFIPSTSWLSSTKSSRAKLDDDDDSRPVS